MLLLFDCLGNRYQANFTDPCQNAFDSQCKRLFGPDLAGSMNLEGRFWYEKRI